MYGWYFKAYYWPLVPHWDWVMKTNRSRQGMQLVHSPSLISTQSNSRNWAVVVGHVVELASHVSWSMACSFWCHILCPPIMKSGNEQFPMCRWFCSLKPHFFGDLPLPGATWKFSTEGGLNGRVIELNGLFFQQTSANDVWFPDGVSHSIEIPDISPIQRLQHFMIIHYRNPKSKQKTTLIQIRIPYDPIFSSILEISHDQNPMFYCNESPWGPQQTEAASSMRCYASSGLFIRRSRWLYLPLPGIP